MNDQATATAKADHADCIFCKIADGQIPARKIHEDDKAVVFHDINPSAPVHFLIIPKQHVVNLYDGAENLELLGHLMSLYNPLVFLISESSGSRSCMEQFKAEDS